VQWKPATVALLVLAVGLAGCSTGTTEVPATVSLALQPVASGFTQPVFLTADLEGRLYVVEQAGLVQRLSGSTATTVLDLRDRVGSGGERGLLGLAFHPEDEDRVFLHYTDRAGDTVLSEFFPWSASSERILLQVDQPYGNHNGGMVAFGPDGFLYLALGDGGAGDDPENRAQDLDALLGKILRIDVDGARPYALPADNPFVGRAGRDEVWAYGLRNPWRFSFDRQTGDLWIGDVGQNRREEINREPAGSPGGVNYGWSRFEGSHLNNRGRDAPGAVGPVAEYDHRTTTGDPHCSVTGGYVYRGTAIPALRGQYVFGDYCSGVVWTLRSSGGSWLLSRTLDTGRRIASFGEDAAGELYLVDHGGTVLRIVAS
jgi:glucose/arabinose dehydrogenase